MTSKAKLEAQARYDKKNTSQIVLKLNNNTDADILKKLENTDNKQGYIKKLLRDDMKKNEILSVDSIKFLLLPTAKKYDIKEIYLFGSYARNEATKNSDVDLLIAGGNYKGLFEYSELIQSIENALGKKIDLVTKYAFNRLDKPSQIIFKNNIERDMVKIYDSRD